MLDYHNSTLLHGKVSGGITVVYDSVLGWGVSFKLVVGDPGDIFGDSEGQGPHPLVPVRAFHQEVLETGYIGRWAKAGCTLCVVGSLADEGLGLFVLADHVGLHDGEWLIKGRG
jgi:hypothetical protein